MRISQESEMISRINALPTLSEIVANLNFTTRKSLGQNFLFDMNITQKIARSVGDLKGTTIEVGPGPGGLTRALLLEKASHVIAIEKDKRAKAMLASLCLAAGHRLTLLEDNALTAPIWEFGITPRRIVANLPYNIATTLLVTWIEHANSFESMTLMFQREVAERITAKTGEPSYGRLSVLVRQYADARILFDLNPSSFIPPPKVVSSVVQIIPLKKPRFKCPKPTLELITRIAFGQRRKMIRSSLKKINADKFLKEAGINPELRPQNIPLEKFCELARVYETYIKDGYQ